MSNPWMMLAVEVSEMGSTFGTGMRTGTEALEERYGAIEMSVSGEWNGRGLGELECEEGT